MADHWHNFIMTFVPLFIVIDAFGNLPFLIMTGQDMDRRQKNKIVNYAVLTATLVGLIFLFLGQFILNVMGIEVQEFAIAGGIVLLILSIRYMITGHMVTVVKEEMVAIVPIGTPLTVGPATIATLLLLAGQFPLYWVLVSFALNMVITWIIFFLSQKIARFMGQGGLTAISRVFSLLLAAIAVSMIIGGLESLGIIGTAG
ncbi:MAG: MarC family transcriptional regulator [Chloroflexi bacterium RBG_16_50_11]|nr:MAG: MarC family transcriptional regulator [Chloroflexi bacterium RBG_16_50_11]